MSSKNEFEPRDRKKYYLESTGTRRFLVRLLEGFFHTIMDLKVKGSENLPLDGPIIIAANHVTNFDVFPIQFTVPRSICFMARLEWFDTPFDPLLRILCAFPAHQSDKDPWATRHSKKVLTQRQALGMFPEGKCSNGAGLGVARTATARMSIETNCPIIPVTVTGTDQFFKRFPLRASVTVTLLPPILPNPGDTPLSLTDRLMFTLADGLPRHMRGVYAEIPKGFG